MSRLRAERQRVPQSPQVGDPVTRYGDLVLEGLIQGKAGGDVLELVSSGRPRHGSCET